MSRSAPDYRFRSSKSAVHQKSCKPPISDVMITYISIGLRSGSVILKNTCVDVAPSTSASKSDVSIPTILLMAGMLGIDTSLFEAAEVDGATSTQVFFKITLPLLTADTDICNHYITYRRLTAHLMYHRF